MASRDFGIIEIPSRPSIVPLASLVHSLIQTAVPYLKTAGTGRRGKYHHSSVNNRRTGKKDQIKRRANIYEVYKQLAVSLTEKIPRAMKHGCKRFGQKSCPVWGVWFCWQFASFTILSPRFICSWYNWRNLPWIPAAFNLDLLVPCRWRRKQQRMTYVSSLCFIVLIL